MRISYNWLKDYVDIKISVERLAEILTMAGLSVDSVKKKGGDSILEIEVTSNRPDWLSYIGVAREVSALTGAKLKIPSLTKIHNTQYTIHNTVSVKVDDKKLCPRYTAHVIRNVKVQESPQWLKKKIEAIGSRPVNNIVDITNFCLFETGEPMHAFDLDKLSGRQIIVRRAAKGERLATIDGTSRVLDGETLVIADSNAPVAIAGVMGGLDTEVGMSTKNILLEAAYFDPISIRRTSRKSALSTESSYRFERKVDILNIPYSSDRAAQLILNIAGGEAGEFIDIGKVSLDKKKVFLRFEKLYKVTGVSIKPAKVKNILTSLGLKVKTSSKEAIKLDIPPFRYDLQNEADIVEEVARIYGYAFIPETLPPVVETGPRMPFDMVVGSSIRNCLIGLGASEIITYGLLSKKILNSANIDNGSMIEIKNPLSAEQEVMRPSLIAGMLNSIRYNINRKNKDLKLFELGKVYFKEGGSFKEKMRLSIGVMGSIYDGWISHARDITFFDLKGMAETLFLKLGIGDLVVKEAPNGIFSMRSNASIEVHAEHLGIMGEVDRKILNNFDIKDRVYILEIDCGAILKHVSREKHFKELPRYPSVLRDISIVVDKNVLNAKIISTIKDTAGGILKAVQLIDRYRGGQIPDGKNGLTYRLEYQDFTKTLEDKDVSDIHSRVVRALESNLGAKLR